MIISRTPFRISFAGGGTDLKAFYSIEPGAVTSTTIKKYMYVAVNKRFDGTIRVSYTRTEIVDDVEKIKHELVREAMKKAGITNGIEITTMADIPAGTGLGSSSALTVGLLNALYAFKGEHISAERLAKEACEVEVDIVKEPIGKQDQYAAAYGGMNHIQFNSDETVFVDPIVCSEKTKKELEGRLMLFFTGITRAANSILDEQKKNTKEKLSYLREMKQLSISIKNALNSNNLDKMGELLRKGWENKKKIVSTISNDIIDENYNKAIKAGALGGKLLGAGGGGFILLYCPKEKQDDVRKALNLKEMKFGFEPQGSKIIYIGD